MTNKSISSNIYDYSTIHSEIIVSKAVVNLRNIPVSQTPYLKE